MSAATPARVRRSGRGPSAELSHRGAGPGATRSRDAVRCVEAPEPAREPEYGAAFAPRARRRYSEQITGCGFETGAVTFSVNHSGAPGVVIVTVVGPAIVGATAVNWQSRVGRRQVFASTSGQD